MLASTLEYLRSPDFHWRKPRTAALVVAAYRAYRRLRRLTVYRTLYRRFRTHTLLTRKGFCDNLAICDQLSIRTLTGSVIECGTWKGGMIAGIAGLLGPERQYYLFDSYEGLPIVDDTEGRDQWGQAASSWQENTAHNDRADLRDAELAMSWSRAKHVTITKGWFADTLPTYRGGPIAILRADGDWYDSTRTILNALAGQVVVGGIVILDDYGYWEGCARAVHEYLAQTGATWRLLREGDYAYMLRVIA